MTYNSMPTAYYADKNISFLSKLVLERIWSLSKQGKREVFFNRQVYADFFGANPASLSKCFKELIDNGYLREVNNKNPFDRTKKFFVINKQSTVEKSNSELTLGSQQTQYSEYCETQQSKSNFHNNLHQTDQYNIEKYRSESVDPTLTLSFDFNSIFYAMNKLKNAFKDYVFTEAELRENAQSYLDKSQLYNAYKGEPTEAKLKAWLKNSIKYLQDKPQASKKTSNSSFEYDFEGAVERLQRLKQLEEQYDRENSEPLEVDYQIIDELEDKNAPA